MKNKSLILKDCSIEQAQMLRDQIGKMRCWLTGFHAGRNDKGILENSIPGEDSLRQIQIILDHSINAAKK